MSKIMGRGAARRVAVLSNSDELDSSDEEEIGTAPKIDDSMDTEEVLYASVFDNETRSIAERVRIRRSSARMSEGSTLAVTPVKVANIPREKASSSKKMIRVIKESGVNKENIIINSSTKINNVDHRRKSRNCSEKKKGQTSSPLRTLPHCESIKIVREGSGKKALSPTHNSEKTNSEIPMEAVEPARPWSIEDFSVGKSIGRGKFGNVYSARQKMPKDSTGKRLTGSGPQVALKVLFKAPMVAARCVHNLRREVEIQSRLKHPNIVQLYGYFDDAKSVYLILQYINGGELYKHVKRNYVGGRIEEWQCRAIIHDVLSALTYMHARNVYHRDIKAENLLLHCQSDKDSDDIVRVCLGDFGWAVHAPPPNNIRYTMCGTPEYLSPEMLSGKGHERYVDVWSCGVLMYELLTGTTPFVLFDEGEVAWQGGTGEAPEGGSQDQEAGSEQAQVFARISKHTFGTIDVTAPFDEGECTISSEAVAFINSLLHPEPSKRPEATKALEHPWMTLQALIRPASL